MRFISLFIFGVVLLFVTQTGCRKDPLNTDSSAKLLFSKDTIVFDTVFTTVGSATRQFKVYNTSSKSVNISSIQLAGGNSSYFHLNIDGDPTTSTENILLRGGDSMYVFVDVDINPNNANSPLMIEDSILFVTNGNHQKVILNAVGQDAYFHYYATLNCNEVWTNDKPHVIYGYAIVPSCCSLTILPGTRVYLHHNAVLAADSCATLKVLGAHGNPATFQGDRLEADYSEEPGQWGYIWLSSLSKDNVIDWAEIKNGTIGILSDSSGGSFHNANPTVTITNTKIRNMTMAGIFGRCSWMVGDNIAVSNCGQYCLAVAYGGKCSFSQCSFGDYWNITSRTTPGVLLNNWYKIDDVTRNERDLLQADFYNCIICGDQASEIGLDSSVTNGSQFQYKFSHCLIKTNVNVSDASHFITNHYNQNPAFQNTDYDLHILNGSAAIDIGDNTIGLLYPNDLDNQLRFNNGIPDAGAYEHQ
jgi:hypothetical protein